MFSDSDHMGPALIELPSGGYLGDYLQTFPAVGGGPSSGRALRSDSSCSLVAVHPYEHHSDASEARFGGGAWYVGEIGYPPSAAREVHLDPRGGEDYDCGEKFPAAAASPDILPAAAAGSPGGATVGSAGRAAAVCGGFGARQRANVATVRGPSEAAQASARAAFGGESARAVITDGARELHGSKSCSLVIALVWRAP